MTGPELRGVSESSEPLDHEPALVALARHRHRAVSDAARWLVANPTLQGAPRGVAWLFEELACKLLEAVHGDDPELTRALVALTQAKDHAVRAKLADVA